MRKISFGFMVLLMSCLLFAGCASKALYQPVDLNPQIKSGKLVQKTDNFTVLFDRSGSMDEAYGRSDRIAEAKNVTGNMVRTIPDIKLTAGLRSFGGDSGANKEDLLYGMTALDKDGYVKKVDGIGLGFGRTPMGRTVLAGGEDLKPLPGKSAMIIVSDFEDLKGIDDLRAQGVVENAKKLKAEFGDRLCIYTIQIGAAKGGKELAQDIAQAAACGGSVNAADLATPQGMADFVERVFLGPAAPAAAKPVPAAPAPVKAGEAKAAPAAAAPAAAIALDNVYFDFDKSTLRPKEREILKEHAAWLTKNKNASIVVEGHCDERGTTEYNLALGERRAAETKKYLVSLGVDESRIKTISYGKERPADPGHDEAAWAKNRRAQFVVNQ